ncbi:GNAT family N-acetyltransferase [Pantoea ananatis]|uniref:GNAT family N-acetyltransferase n=1 Tax=Pantoea ananas TaxID=553 RepID=UPI00351D4702
MCLIRTAELGDAPSLHELFIQLGYQTKPDDLCSKINGIGESFNVLVAEFNEKICGVIVVNFICPVHEDGLWAIISALVIDESYRGKGLGKKLLTTSEQLALEKKCSRIELASGEKRIRAHQFYESNGYREVRKRFVKHLVDN